MSRTVARLERPLGKRAAAQGFAVVLVALIAAMAFFGFAESRREPAEARVDTATSLQTEAGTIVADVFSANAASWKQDRDRARMLVTETFASSAATGFSAGAPAGVRAVKWEPLSTGVARAEADSGTALVVVRVTVEPDAGEPTVQTKSVNADFVRTDGRWLLDGLDELQ